MTSCRLFVLFVAIAFACFVPGVIEGRLFDPKAPVRISNDGDVSNDESSLPGSESDPSQTSISVDAASSESTGFVESSKSGSMCDHIRPDELPEECSCSEPGPFALVIECVKTFNSTYFNDTIGMKIDLDPCNENGSRLSMDVTEKEHHVDYPIVGIRAGESKNIPIPGLAMIVPGVGNVGLDVAVLIVGNPDMLRLKIGLNACAQTSTDHLVCASSIPGVANILPWYILKGTYSFGDICESNRIKDGSSGNVEESTTTILVE